MRKTPTQDSKKSRRKYKTRGNKEKLRRSHIKAQQMLKVQTHCNAH